MDRKKIRQVLVALVGTTVTIAGIIMIVTPGPAIIVIPLGLGILATEFLWARHALHKMKQYVAEKTKRGSSPSDSSPKV